MSAAALALFAVACLFTVWHELTAHLGLVRLLAFLRGQPVPAVPHHHAWWTSRSMALRAGADIALALAGLAAAAAWLVMPVLTVVLLSAADFAAAYLMARSRRAHLKE